MKAITLWQPWATWIAWGWKTIETRMHDRFKSLVGQRIAIHAGKRWDKNAARIARQWLTFYQQTTPCVERAVEGLGSIVCTIRVERVTRMSTCDEARSLCPWEPGRVSYELADRIPVFPVIPCDGHQGIWSVPDDVLCLLKQRGAA